MAAEDFNHSDTRTVMLAKMVRNQSAVMSGGEALKIVGGGTPGGARTYDPIDNDRTLLIKLLQNEADVMNGDLSYTIS